MCEYCNEKNNESQYNAPLARGEWTDLSMFIIENFNDSYSWVLMAEGDDEAFIKINYCPFCGRKLV